MKKKKHYSNGIDLDNKPVFVSVYKRTLVFHV